MKSSPPDKPNSPRQKIRVTDEQKLPTYRRSSELRTPVKENLLESHKKHPGTMKPIIRVAGEEIAKIRETRQKARSKTLKEPDNINVNEKLAEAQAKRKQRLADLDKEL